LAKVLPAPALWFTRSLILVPRPLPAVALVERQGGKIIWKVWSSPFVIKQRYALHAQSNIYKSNFYFAENYVLLFFNSFLFAHGRHPRLTHHTHFENRAKADTRVAKQETNYRLLDQTSLNELCLTSSFD
jgi:hypothetical protein